MKCAFFLCFVATLFSKEHFLKNILSDETICKTYEISIPDYEHVTNPSIIPYKNEYLLSFRYDGRLPEWFGDTGLKRCASFIGLAHLDKQFRVKKKSVQLLEIRSYSEDFSLYAEDARLFVFQDRIFLTFNDFPSPSPEYIRQLYLGEIAYENGRWISKKRALPLILDNMNRIEKNWVPFFVDEPRPKGRGMIWEGFRTPPKCGSEESGPEGPGFKRPDQCLFLIYGEDPHTILECDLSTGHCQKVDERTVDLDWPYGPIRGGTPALKINDQFLTFYHSSIEESDIYDRRIYFMAAYIFDSFFPFTIRGITPQPIGLTEYYKDTSSSKKHSTKKVLFPGGFVQEGNRLHLAWGKDDKMIMITTLDLERLLKLMKPIKYAD